MNTARNAAVAALAAAAVLTLTGCLRGGQPTPPESSGLSFPSDSAEEPPRPSPALAPYVVAGHGRSGDSYTVMCIPKREYDADDDNPDHAVDIPVTRKQFETLGFGKPCPLPAGWQSRPADRM
ncbi:MAG TPA: hypothetical protein VGL02_24785 [Streptomyces sp.]